MSIEQDYGAFEDEPGVVTARLSETTASASFGVVQNSSTSNRKQGLITKLVRKSGEVIRQIGLTDLWGLPPKYWADGASHRLAPVCPRWSPLYL